MRCFYAVQTSVLRATPPPAPWHAVTCPDLPAWSLVVVDGWPDHAVQDAWEDLPGVIEHPVWNWAAPVPAAVVAAFGSWGVVATDTLGQAMRRIRAHWPGARA